MLTAAKEGTFSASSDPCVLFPLAASGVYQKTRVWGSKPENVHCSSVIGSLKVELRSGCEESNGKSAVGSGVTFKYDPFGRRIYKQSPSATSIFAYDGANLIETVNATGGLETRYTQGQNIDEPLAESISGTTSYYEADGLGSISSLSTTAGALADTYTYDSFGNTTNSSGSLTNFFRYTARESDTETGLYYYRARYYDSTTGRYFSQDPVGFWAGGNFYAYVRNHPSDLVDPSGLLQVCCRPANVGLAEFWADMSLVPPPCHCFLKTTDGHTMGGYHNYGFFGRFGLVGTMGGLDLRLDEPTV